MRTFTRFLFFITLMAVSNWANAQYCLPTPADCAFGDGFSNFQLGTISNVSGCEADNGVTGYGDFTALQTDLNQGLSYDAFFETQFGGQVISMWIDFDDSDSFEPSELMITDFNLAAGFVLTPVNFTVPLTAPLGLHRMRIQAAFNEPSSPDPCTSGFFGETEDYTVNIIPAPSCAPSSALTLDNINGESATVSWTSGSGSNYNWEVVPAGNAQGVGTVDSGTSATTSATVMNLMPLMSYDFYLQDDCGGGDLSIWVGPFTLNTPNDYCVTGTFTDSGGPNGTYDPNANETYVICPNNPGDIAVVNFTEFQIESGFENMAIYDGPNTGSPLIGNFEGNNSPGSLVPTDPSGCLTFVFTSDGSVQQDGWVATVLCVPAPTCPSLNNVAVTAAGATTATVTFNFFGPGNSFILEYGPPGFVPGSGTQVGGFTGSPATLSGLTPSTDYDVYVYEDCGGGDLSLPGGPASFATACVAIPTFPACEDFPGTTLPNCWEQSANNDWDVGTTGPAYGAQGVQDHTGNGTAFIWVDGSGMTSGETAELLTPFYDVASLNAPYLSFWVFSDNIDAPGDNNTLTVELWDGAAWVLVETIADDNPDWIEYTVDVNQVATLTGTEIQFRFTFIATATNNIFWNDILLDDVCMKERPANDVGVTEIFAPTSGCGLGMENVEVEVSNLGFNTQGGFFTFFAVNGTIVNTIPDGFITNNLVSGAVENYTFSTQYDFSAFGTYTIQAWTDLPSDQDATNDTTTIVINNIPVISGLPFTEDFESGTGGFTVENGNGAPPTTWELGAPAGGVINTANSGTNVMMTDLDGQYDNNSETYLVSPCIDFTDFLVDPELSFAVNVDSEDNFDGLQVEISLDGGATWTLLGTAADPGWYYNTTDDWFDGTVGWTTVTHALDGTAGESNVRIRFSFTSDGSVNGFDGAAIDDISIIDVCAAGFGLTGTGTDETTEDVSMDGSATVSTSSGTGPFTYEWSNGGIGQTINGLSAGTYTVTVTDASGCKDVTTVTIGAVCVGSFLNPLAFTPETQNTTTNDGSATASVIPTTPPYNFEWSNGDMTTGDMTGSNTIMNLTTGIYSVTVTDGNGCSDVETIVVTSICPINLASTSSVTDESVDGAEDGSATVTPTEGTGPYTYAWSSGGSGATEMNLGAGTYTVTITDANGCFEEISVTLGFTCPTDLGASATSTDESIDGATDGTVSASASAGTPPYSYTWSNAATGNFQNGLAPGTYTVTITDANGCEDTASATVDAGGFAVSTENIASLGSLSIAPNPTKGNTVLNVNFTETVDLNIRLTNTVGQVISVQEFVNTSAETVDFNLNELPSGVYFLSLQVGNEIHTERLIKQ